PEGRQPRPRPATRTRRTRQRPTQVLAHPAQSQRQPTPHRPTGQSHPRPTELRDHHRLKKVPCTRRTTPQHRGPARWPALADTLTNTTTGYYGQRDRIEWSIWFIQTIPEFTFSFSFSIGFWTSSNDRTPTMRANAPDSTSA